MNGNGKLFSMLLFLLGFGLFIYVGYTISELVDVSSTTVDFTDENSNIEISVQQDSNFYLMIDFVSGNNYELVDYTDNCSVIHTGSDTTEIICNIATVYSDSFELELTDLDNGDRILFEDMGNTSITTNDYHSIAKISLPEGNYRLNVLNSTMNGNANIKFEDASIIGYILKIVFGLIVAIGSMVGFIVLKSMSKRSRSIHHGNEYYDQQMQQQDKNNELFDDDDPFKEYDKY